MNKILLELNTTNFWVLNWYYIVAVIISFTSLVFGIKNFYKKNKAKEEIKNDIIPKIEQKVEQKIEPIISPVINPIISPIISPINSVNVNIGNMDNNSESNENDSEKKSENREALIDYLKLKVKILFIDDDKKFNIVKIFKDSKWKNTNSTTDIKSVDEPKVKEADIIFVDINGVGKLLNCKDEGLDIALMLKQKYPNKKIIIYSANKNNDNFHPAWDLCDFKLEKNALSYQYLSLVEQYSLELYS